MRLADVVAALYVLRSAGLKYADWPKTEDGLNAKARAYGDALRHRKCDVEDLREAALWFARNATDYPTASELAERAGRSRAARFVSLGVETEPGVIAIREVPLSSLDWQVSEPPVMPAAQDRELAKARLAAQLERAEQSLAARHMSKPVVAFEEDQDARRRLGEQVTAAKDEA